MFQQLRQKDSEWLSSYFNFLASRQERQLATQTMSYDRQRQHLVATSCCRSPLLCIVVPVETRWKLKESIYFVKQ
jgi:hypothetical protein